MCRRRVLWVADKTAVQPDHPVIKLFADLQGAFEITGKDIGDKAVFGRIGPPDRIVLIGERLDRGDGAEDFVMHAIGRFGDV